MLNSAEHEILYAHKYRNNNKFSFSDKPRMLFFLLLIVKMPTIVGNITFVSRKSVMLSSVEHEKNITSGTGTDPPNFTSYQIPNGKYGAQSKGKKAESQ